MARLLKTSLGMPSGKLGDNVFRIMNGKAFISLRPEHYRPTKSEKLKAARKNFAAATSFAKSQKPGGPPPITKIHTTGKGGSTTLAAS